MPLAREPLEDVGRPVLRAVVGRDHEVGARVQVKREPRLDDVGLVSREQCHDERHRRGSLRRPARRASSAATRCSARTMPSILDEHARPRPRRPPRRRRPGRRTRAAAPDPAGGTCRPAGGGREARRAAACRRRACRPQGRARASRRARPREPRSCETSARPAASSRLRVDRAMDLSVPTNRSPIASPLPAADCQASHCAPSLASLLDRPEREVEHLDRVPARAAAPAPARIALWLPRSISTSGSARCATFWCAW